MVATDASGRILAALLETRTGQQLTMSRRWRIETALQSLVRERGLRSVEDLVALLIGGGEADLADKMVEALLNNETYFYRDRAAFDLLIRGALPRLRRARERDRRLSIWCAGCSTGQEAYSIAMSIAEDPAWQGWRIDIVGSDVSAAAIEQARAGVYSQFEVQRGLPVLQMIRWFEDKGDQKWRIADELRRKVRFEVRSLIDPAPAAPPFDLILCRNVLLYFSKATRHTVFDRLAAASAPDATLMLGAGETIIGQTSDFVIDPEHRGLYVRAPIGEAASRQSRVG